MAMNGQIMQEVLKEMGLTWEMIKEADQRAQFETSEIIGKGLEFFDELMEISLQIANGFQRIDKGDELSIAITIMHSFVFNHALSTYKLLRSGLIKDAVGCLRHLYETADLGELFIYEPDLAPGWLIKGDKFKPRIVREKLSNYIQTPKMQVKKNAYRLMSEIAHPNFDAIWASVKADNKEGVGWLFYGATLEDKNVKSVLAYLLMRISDFNLQVAVCYRTIEEIRIAGKKLVELRDELGNYLKSILNYDGE